MARYAIDQVIDGVHGIRRGGVRFGLFSHTLESEVIVVKDGYRSNWPDVENVRLVLGWKFNRHVTTIGRARGELPHEQDSANALLTRASTAVDVGGI